eukprot:707349_1
MATATCDTPRERCCSTNKLPAYIILLIYLSASVALAECAQITLSKAHRPYFIRYINSSMAIMLFIFPLFHRVQTYLAAPSKSSTGIELQLFNTTSTETKSHSYASPHSPIIQGSFLGFMFYTLLGAIMHTGGGLLYYTSLTGITVPTAMTLMKLKAIWVLILSIVFLKHPISVWKCLAIIISFVGIFCYVEEVRESGGQHHVNNTEIESHIPDTWWGCLTTLLASIVWAVADIWMNITFKKFFPQSKYYGSLTYEAWIGLWTIPIFCFTIFVQQPLWSILTADVWKWIVLTGIVLTITNAAFFTAISVTSPVWMNYAGFLTIPCSFVVDVIVHEYRVSVLAILGAVFIIFGFLMLEVVNEPRWFTHLMDGLKQNVFGYGVSKSNHKMDVVI